MGVLDTNIRIVVSAYMNMCLAAVHKERAEAEKQKQAKDARRELAQKEEQRRCVEAELAASRKQAEELRKDLKVKTSPASGFCQCWNTNSRDESRRRRSPMM